MSALCLQPQISSRVMLFMNRYVLFVHFNGTSKRLDEESTNRVISFGTIVASDDSGFCKNISNGIKFYFQFLAQWWLTLFNLSTVRTHFKSYMKHFLGLWNKEWRPTKVLYKFIQRRMKFLVNVKRFRAWSDNGSKTKLMFKFYIILNYWYIGVSKQKNVKYKCLLFDQEPQNEHSSIYCSIIRSIDISYQ